MRQQHHRAVGDDRQLAHQADELAHLRAVDLVAGKSVSGGVDANVPGPDVGGRFEQPLEQWRRLHLALPVRYGQHRVGAGERQQVQTAGGQVRELDTIEFGDARQPAVQFVGVVLGAVIDRRAGLR